MEELRELMRRVPAPVAVLTFEVEGRRFGVTVGSVVSLSLDPPLVGVAIGLQSSTHGPIREAETFAVNALAGNQGGLAQHFARSVPPLVMWDGVPVRDGDGPPLLEDALGWILCRRGADYPAGDHTIFLGEVQSVEYGRDAPGLAYLRQSYRPV